MALKLEDKKVIVANLAKVAGEALSLVAADYRGLTVSQMTDFRAKARQAGLYVKVVRNTLAKRAFQDTAFACLHDSLTGPMILVFSNEEPGAGARLVRDFMKDNEALEVKVLSIGGELLEASTLEKVARLPTRKEALSSLVVVLQAPVTRFVRTLAEPYAQVVRVIEQIRDQKQAAAR